MRGFRFQLTEDGWNAIIDSGTSIEYGARELKRTMQRVFVKPVAALYSQKQIPPTSTVVLDHQDGQFGILIAK
jgi:ATP-dependent Clp protease ATP-binding subunit ClpA